MILMDTRFLAFNAIDYTNATIQIVTDQSGFKNIQIELTIKTKHDSDYLTTV